MQRFLLSCHDAGGTVPPMLAIAQEMVARGHQVTMVSQPSVRDRAMTNGCRFVTFDGIGDYDRHTAIEQQLDVVLPLMTGAEIGTQLLAVARDEQVDAVVVDCNLAGAAGAVETLGVPSALLLHSMFTTYTEVWFADVWPFLEPLINETRAAFGLGAARSWVEVFAGHDRLFSAVPASFDIPVATPVPESMRRVGFLVPESTARGGNNALPNGPAPAVLVSLSTTYQHQEGLLGRIVDALAVRPVRALVTTSGHMESSASPASPNVELVDYVDHARVLDDVDVLVTHAGLGTVAAGLSHGVPLVCVPLGRDQHVNAGRVADVGAGIALAPDAIADEIGVAIDRVLSESTFREAAAAVAAASHAAGGAAAAVDELESLLPSG